MLSDYGRLLLVPLVLTSWAAGAESLSLKPRIVGGEPVVVADHPWVASLQGLPWGDFSAFYSQHQCGASIIAPDWVLTAAHCTDGQRQVEMRVVIGGGDVTPQDLTEQQLLPVAAVYQFADYDDSSLDQDLTLLYVPGARASIYAQPATAAQTNALRQGDLLRVVGYGITEDNDVSTRLLGVDQPFRGIGQGCTSVPVWGADWLTDNMLCAGAVAGEDSCQGDSGGPLFVRSGNTVIQHGLVSWGFAECGERYPSVYTRLANYGDWLAAQQQWGVATQVLMPQLEADVVTATMAVTNHGQQAVTLDEVAIPAGWTLTADPCSGQTLAAGGQCELRLSLPPRANGGKVSVVAADGEERQATLTVPRYRSLFSDTTVSGHVPAFSNWSLVRERPQATFTADGGSAPMLLVAARAGALRIDWQASSDSAGAILYNLSRNAVVGGGDGRSGSWTAQVNAGDRLELVASAGGAATLTLTNVELGESGFGADDSGGGGSVGLLWLVTLAALVRARRRP